MMISEDGDSRVDRHDPNDPGDDRVGLPGNPGTARVKAQESWVSGSQPSEDAEGPTIEIDRRGPAASGAQTERSDTLLVVR
jgi:hypothetical protein